MVICRLNLFNKWRVTFTFAPVQWVYGVNNMIMTKNGIKYFPMWDFDDTTLHDVIEPFLNIIPRYRLSNVYVYQTSPHNYYAYSLKLFDWIKCVHIISAHPKICQSFFKWGVYRGRFTLRISEKNGYKPKLVVVIKGVSREDFTLDQLRSYVKYQTLKRKRPVTIFQLMI